MRAAQGISAGRSLRTSELNIIKAINEAMGQFKTPPI
jgi:hypothetical protein